MKAAVIYYSRSGITAKIAKKIESKFSADMYFVQPKKAYGSYASAVIRAGREKLAKSPAAVVNQVRDFSEYDVIFFGFPVWYGTCPDFMQEYIKKCGIKNKTIVPFVTAGGNGKDSSLNTVRELFTSCEIKGYFYTTAPKDSDVDTWLESLQLG